MYHANRASKSFTDQDMRVRWMQPQGSQTASTVVQLQVGGNSPIPSAWTRSCCLPAILLASMAPGLSFQFPYVTPAPHEPVKTLRSLVNIRKDSLRLVRYFRAQLWLSGVLPAPGICGLFGLEELKMYVA